MHVVLFQPEIPPNTGNIIRICANTGDSLHLIRPLGFEWDDKRLRRAGLDYHDFTNVTLHDTLEHCQSELSGRRWFAMTTKGSRNFAEIAFEADDVVLYGPRREDCPMNCSINGRPSVSCASQCSPTRAASTLPIPLPSPSTRLGVSGATTAFFSEWSGQYLRLGSFAVAPAALLRREPQSSPALIEAVENHL